MSSGPATFLPRNTAQGIGLMLVGILLFSLNDTLGKWLVATYSVGQVLLLRSAAALLVLLPFLRRGGSWRLIHPAQPGLQLLRIGFSTLELTLFYWSVSYLSLADVMTYYLAAPVYVAALAPLLLGEAVGWRRWIAILVGFAGVVVALEPSTETLTWPALIAVTGSVAFALMMITGRKLRGTPDLALVVGQTAGGLLAGAATAGFGWVTPGVVDLMLLAVVGIVAMSAHLCLNRSLKLADAAVVTPFQYTLLIWAILFGYLFFGDYPRPAMLLGAAIIVASGLFLLAAGRRMEWPAASDP